jgi:molybdopterin synthase sulfur carrier subunit
MPMNLQVKLFAKARDLVNSGVVEVALPDAATVSVLRQALVAQYPKLLPLVSSLLVAVGAEYAHDETVLEPNSDVACFPPVSGG